MWNTLPACGLFGNKLSRRIEYERMQGHSLEIRYLEESRQLIDSTLRVFKAALQNRFSIHTISIYYLLSEPIWIIPCCVGCDRHACPVASLIHSLVTHHTDLVASVVSMTKHLRLSVHRTGALQIIRRSLVCALSLEPGC